MAGVESSQTDWQPGRQERRFRMSPLEWGLLVAMLLTITVTGLDALEGRSIGKSDELALAKLRGQQELMASVNK